MKNQLKLFILTFICAVFSPSIIAVKSLKQLCINQLPQVLVSDDMLEQFRNSPDFIQEMGLNFVEQKYQNKMKDAILSSYCPTVNALRLKAWLVSISPITLAISLTDHNGPVNSVAWSPDGSRLATGSDDRTAKIWDSQNGGAPLHIFGHNGSVNSIAWSPDGSHLATGSDDYTAKIWNSETGDLLHTLDHDCWVTSIAWSPDGSSLATASEDRTAKIWDSQNGGAPLHTINHNSSVYSWSPDGSRLATASKKWTSKIWNTQYDTFLQELTGHKKIILSMAWSPDGSRIATGSKDRTLRIWNSQTGALMNIVTDCNYSVSSVAWSPDGSRLATGSFDSSTAKIWNLAQLKDLSLDQILFLVLVYHDYCNNQPLTLNDSHEHLYTIYCSLPADIQNSISNRIHISSCTEDDYWEYGYCY